MGSRREVQLTPVRQILQFIQEEFEKGGGVSDTEVHDHLTKRAQGPTYEELCDAIVCFMGETGGQKWQQGEPWIDIGPMNFQLYTVYERIARGG